MRTGDTWSFTEWTAGGGGISGRTFQGTFSRPRAGPQPQSLTSCDALRVPPRRLLVEGLVEDAEARSMPRRSTLGDGSSSCLRRAWAMR